MPNTDPLYEGFKKPKYIDLQVESMVFGFFLGFIVACVFFLSVL